MVVAGIVANIFAHAVGNSNLKWCAAFIPHSVNLVTESSSNENVRIGCYWNVVIPEDDFLCCRNTWDLGILVAYNYVTHHKIKEQVLSATVKSL